MNVIVFVVLVKDHKVLLVVVENDQRSQDLLQDVELILLQRSLLVGIEPKGTPRTLCLAYEKKLRVGETSQGMPNNDE